MFFRFGGSSVTHPVGQADCEDILDHLKQRLLVVEDLHHRFVQYQSSFHKLLLEITRRQRYREATEKMVEDMIAQLDDRSSGERTRTCLFEIFLTMALAQRNVRGAKTLMPYMVRTYQRTFVCVSRTRRRGGMLSRGRVIPGRCSRRLMGIC